ncbi:hypothetical protein WMY93_010173 [Mugilogobius chulae]|uniref:SAP domain-containing protein n=1 Tax=Mugilogobius chulae TaxID=88201 RepID=A0AAW0PFQ5_9GOBI
MLDTNHCLSFEPSPSECSPIGEDFDKEALKMDLDRHVYHSLKEVLQLKLQQRRTREELVSQGIMPPLKSPAAFHEQRRSLERARTEDYLKRKIRSRPERSELVRMHILEETSAEPSLQAKQLQLKRARLADDLNDKISHRPGPIELVHKNILSVPYPVHNALLDSPKGAGGESSSLDEDSSDALSPDQLTNHDSPLSVLPQMSPSEGLSPNGDLSPTQFLTQAPPPPPPPPPPLPMTESESTVSKVTNGTPVTSPTSRPTPVKSQAKSSSDRPPQRSKKAKDNKPKMDSSYAKLLQQQQLFLQLQILNQQQQHYNYHTILPAPPKSVPTPRPSLFVPLRPPNDQPPTTSSGPSPSRTLTTTTTAASSNQNTAVRPTQTTTAGTKPGALPLNLDEFKVAELKAELKLRGLTVSGTKNDLIERLRNYQEQNGAAAVKNVQTTTSVTTSAPSSSSSSSSSVTSPTPDPLHSGEMGIKISLPSMGQVQPHQIMRFGSTSSSPPVSPSPSERSLAGMSPDETSCNGDMFGEMVSSPLTQLSLHPSPQHPSSSVPSLPQTLCTVKEETLQKTSCSFSKPEPAVTMDTSSMDKDQMLQEKDKQIEELTRMLRQKQQLVETLRSQLEQGKIVKKEDEESKPACIQVKSQTLIKASAIQPPTLPNGVVLKLKREDPEEKMEEEAQIKKATPPMQCSQETLLKLQQIHRLQVQQAEQHKQQPTQVQKATEVKSAPLKTVQLKKDPQLLLRQQQQIQQLLIQQTQQQQQQHNNNNRSKRKVSRSNRVQSDRSSRRRTSPAANQTAANQKAGSNQHKRQLRVQQRQQQKQPTAPVTTQQVTSLVINQQNGTQIHTQAISLDLLKTNGAATLVTDSNGNHYLIALTSNPGDGQNGVSSLAKTNGRITLQRLQSTPTKLPSSNSSDNQSKEQPPAEPVKKVQKPGCT